jgi:energy-coupling factor transport system substrate-specific component
VSQKALKLLSAKAWRRLVVLAALAVLFALAASSAYADTIPPNRAGVVARFGDGSVRTACVDLGTEDQITGEELLRRAGLAPVMEYSSLGGIVCSIDGQGCGYPQQACWCQCKGDPCIYWQYYHLVDGVWTYATIGASSHMVQAGDVDGWSWGAGEEEEGLRPPLISLETICRAPVADGLAAEPAATQAPLLYTPVPASVREGPSLLEARPAQAAPAADTVDAAIPATGPGDYAFLGGVFLIVVAGAVGLRVAGASQQAAAARHPSPSGPFSRQNGLGLAVYALSIGIGLVALLYPFLIVVAQTGAAESARSGESLLLLFVLMGLCLAALLVEVQGQAVSAKRIALLGILVAINSVVRFVEVAIPGPGGFSPIFFLIILSGYVYGGRFGFLMGSLTMLVSALITGGVGPWLPGQMFTAGWVGLSAPLARPVVRAFAGLAYAGSRSEVIVLAAVGGLWGFAYGGLMNLWFWPFMAGPAEQAYQAGLELADIVRRYLAFYLVTSLVWDLMAALGNMLLILAFGRPTLAALRRFQQRFEFDYQLQPPPVPQG